MKREYIDTHAHINGKYDFDNQDIWDILEMAKKEGVTRILMPGTNIEDSLNGISISKKFPFTYPGIGIHPCEVDENDFTQLIKLINIDLIYFVGETGIDLYREDNPSLEKQVESFIKHLDFAKAHRLPVVVHTRNSLEETYEILERYKNAISIIMHSFTGDYEWAMKFINIGCYISFSGIVTFKNASEIQKAAKLIPLDKILIETDSPFLAPTPYRGKTNQPAFVKYVGDWIASNREENDETVISAILQNTLKAFNI